MRLYERYFARQIYWAFLFILFTFSALFLFFDLMSELNSIGHGNYKFGLAVIRVLLLAPSRCYELVPIAALISAIYVFATLAAHSEYTILRVSGLSTWRTLGTLLKIGAPLVALTFLIGEVIGPYTNQLSERGRMRALGAAVSSNFRSGVWVKDTVTETRDGQRIMRFINVGQLNADTTISDVRIYEFDLQFHLRNIRFAQSGSFVPPDHWALKGVTETQLIRTAPTAAPALSPSARQTASPARPPLAAAPSQAAPPLYRSSTAAVTDYRMYSQLTPQILSVLLVTPNQMSLVNLYSYIRHLQDNNQNAQRYEIALWRKLLYPFAVLVMLVLSLPFAYLHTRAGVIGVKVFGGIMLGISFQLLNTLFSHIGTLDTWPAPLTAAIPSLLYLALGLCALRWIDRH